MKKKLMSANDKDNSSSPCKRNLENVSDSDCDDSNHQESESLLPDTGDMEEFPALKNWKRYEAVTKDLWLLHSFLECN